MQKQRRSSILFTLKLTLKLALALARGLAPALRETIRDHKTPRHLPHILQPETSPRIGLGLILFCLPSSQLLPKSRHRELRAPMATRTGSTGAATYADCVDSLRNSLKFLEASVETIDRGVSDFPRLVNVLKTVRPTLAAAEASLRDEIGPYIAFLLSRADAQVERQERRIETLKARAELQQGRLTRPDDPARSASRPASARSRQLRGEDKLRARIVRQRKEALRYGIERLELEVLQKERELRKRLENRYVLVPLPVALLNHHDNAGRIGFHDAFVSAKSCPHTGLTSSVRPPIALGQTCLLRARVRPPCLALSALSI
ncbi:hypothetical protein Trihar35433_5879 [Trichoderma harzianum]|nr:hypothetical protein Trihar35433_5879 [Trichoderma harzianum]